MIINVDELAQEIRRVDGNHSLGAGMLAEALLPFLNAQVAIVVQEPIGSVFAIDPINMTARIQLNPLQNGLSPVDVLDNLYLARTVAAPIVATGDLSTTVPSEHQLWNAACAIRELEFEDVPLPDCMVLIHEILDPYLAAPSHTEQASDVRNAERYRYLKRGAYSNHAPNIAQDIEPWYQDYNQPPKRNEYPRIIDVGLDQAIDAAIRIDAERALKSATPADKGCSPSSNGNAPAEAKS